MKTLDTSKDKIDKICDKLRKETLEPAKEEANQIIASARKKGESIIEEAEKQAEHLIKQAKAQIEQERNVFHSSMQQSTKQTVEALRQEIDKRLFNEEIDSVLESHIAAPQVVAQLINGIVNALQKDGIEADLSVAIPKAVSAADVSALLLSDVKKRLKDKPLTVGDFKGGAQVKLVGKKMTIDISDIALKELFATYARKDFRKLIFSH